jgi:hypothetical protein
MTTTELIDGAISVLQDLPVHAEQLVQWTLSNAWWIALLVFAVCGAVGTGRFLASRRPLADRGALELLPTTGFDPKVEEVIRFAHQLTRAHKSISRWNFTPARGTAIRIRFNCPGGLLTMRMEGPSKALSVLRHQGYAQCEIRLVEDGVPALEHPQIQLGAKSLASRRPAAA